MSDKNAYLHLLINEPLYLVNEQSVKVEKAVVAEPVIALEPDLKPIQVQAPIVPVQTIPLASIPVAAPLVIARKPLGVVVNYANANQFPEIESTLLSNILKAVGFDLLTAEMIFSETGVFEEGKLLHFDKMIVFGISTNSHLYQIHKKDDCQILTSDSLTKINADISLKKQLWVQLQAMFTK